MFQPVVDLDTGLTVAYEVLARGPETSPLNRPDLLFAAARQCGRLTELDLACQYSAMEAALSAGLTGPARDLGDSGPDLQRRFEFVLSHVPPAQSRARWSFST